MRLYCLYESRPTHADALALAAESLLATAPGSAVRLYAPPGCEGRFARYRAVPGVELLPAALPPELGWNIKPAILLAALAAGADEAIWLDSDLIVLRDPAPLLDGLDTSVLVATEEALWGKDRIDDGQRTAGWGLTSRRTFGVTLNSCVLRVTGAHRQLIEHWAALLGSADYRAAQRLGWGDRPTHMIGDQDVLTALLGADPYTGLPVRVLRRGGDIIQFFGPVGFTIAERLMLARGDGPVFVHSQGGKPWASGEPGTSPLDRFLAVYLDTSPYVIAARRYAASLPDPAWLEPRTRLGRRMRRLGAGNLAWTGAPLALVADIAFLPFRLRKSLRRIWRRRRLSGPVDRASR